MGNAIGKRDSTVQRGRGVLQCRSNAHNGVVVDPGPTNTEARIVTFPSSQVEAGVAIF